MTFKLERMVTIKTKFTSSSLYLCCSSVFKWNLLVRCTNRKISLEWSLKSKFRFKSPLDFFVKITWKVQYRVVSRILRWALNQTSKVQSRKAITNGANDMVEKLGPVALLTLQYTYSGFCNSYVEKLWDSKFQVEDLKCFVYF